MPDVGVVMTHARGSALTVTEKQARGQALSTEPGDNSTPQKNRKIRVLRTRKKERKGLKNKVLRESPGQAKPEVPGPVVREPVEARGPAHPLRFVEPRAAPQHTRAVIGMISIQHRLIRLGIVLTVLTVLRSRPFPDITSQIMYNLTIRLNR